MPCMKTQTNRCRSTGQQPRTKSGFRPADKPLVNRTFCSSIGLHRISLVRASKETFRTGVFDALGGTRDGCLLGEPIRRRPVLPGPARPAMRRPDPTRPWYVRVLDSTGTSPNGCMRIEFDCGSMISVAQAGNQRFQSRNLGARFLPGLD